MRMTDRWIQINQKRAAQKAAEADGKVADSLEVRKAILARVHAGEITLGQAQAKISRIQRKAKANGQITRSQAFSGRRP